MKTKNPKLATPILELADLAYHRGDKKAAITGYQHAMKLYPDSIFLRLKMASLYNDAGQSEQAITEFQTVLKKEPNSEFALNQLASTYLEKLHKPQQALAFAERAQKLNNHSPDINYTLATISYELSQYPNAVAYYEKAGQVPNADFYFNAAKAFAKINDTKKSAHLLEQALNGGPATTPNYKTAEDMLHRIWNVTR